MVNNIYNTEGGYVLSKEHELYYLYRDLAFLNVIYFLSKGNRVQLEKEQVKKKMLEIFPEEVQYEELLRAAELFGSIEQTDNTLNITDLGIESAERLSFHLKEEISAAMSS